MSTEKVQKDTTKVPSKEVEKKVEYNNLNEALLAVQKIIKSAKKTSDNLYFKSKYADLSSVYESVKSPFNEAGILIQQIEDENIMSVGDTVIIKNYIVTKLIFVKTGESIDNRTEIVCKEKNNPQAYGSAITYARRYGLMTVCGIDTEDDDGNGANSYKKMEKILSQSQDTFSKMMPEWLSQKGMKDAIDSINSCNSIEELQSIFTNLGEYKKVKEIVEAKDAKKKELMKEK